MRLQRTWFLAVGLAAVVAVTALLSSRDSRPRPATQPQVHRSTPEVSAANTLFGREAEERATPRQHAATEGEPQLGGRAAVNLAGTVRDVLGAPIVGATVDVCPLLKEFDVRNWRGQAWGEIDRVTMGSVTPEDGSFEVVDRLVGPFALIVSKEGYLGRSIALRTGNLNPMDLVVILEEAPPIRVAVRDRSGRAYEGAQVHLYGAYSWRVESLGEPLHVRASRVVRHEVISGADGRCTLPAFAGHLVLVAEHGTLVSEPFSGEATNSVELVLSPGFSVRGLVTGVEFPLERSRASVVVEAWSTSWEGDIGRLPIRDDGTFGPLRFAARESGRGACRLEGGNLLGEVPTFDYPTRDEDVFVELEASLGEVLALRVVDSGREPVANAAVIGRFNADPQLTAWEYTDAAGEIDLAGLPLEESVDVRVVAEGFATLDVGTSSSDENEEERLTLELVRPGQVEVIVHYAGEPVSDYTLMSWQDSFDAMGVEKITGGRSGPTFVA